jgi:hypothetical protein
MVALDGFTPLLARIRQVEFVPLPISTGGLILEMMRRAHVSQCDDREVRGQAAQQRFSIQAEYMAVAINGHSAAIFTIPLRALLRLRVVAQGYCSPKDPFEPFK